MSTETASRYCHGTVGCGPGSRRSSPAIGSDTDGAGERQVCSRRTTTRPRIAAAGGEPEEMVVAGGDEHRFTGRELWWRSPVRAYAWAS
jgi:hypothetical protein